MSNCSVNCPPFFFSPHFVWLPVALSQHNARLGRRKILPPGPGGWSEPEGCPPVVRWSSSRLDLHACTITQNQLTGPRSPIRGKRMNKQNRRQTQARARNRPISRGLILLGQKFLAQNLNMRTKLKAYWAGHQSHGRFSACRISLLKKTLW